MILLICINKFAIFVVYLQKINCIPAIEASFHYATLQYQVI